LLRQPQTGNAGQAGNGRQYANQMFLEPTTGNRTGSGAATQEHGHPPKLRASSGTQTIFIAALGSEGFGDYPFPFGQVAVPPAAVAYVE
jgi:hypothetical protein